jgi:hypothetical protein
MLKLDVMPIYAGWDGWAYMNDPKPKEPKYEGLPADEDIGF